MIKDTNCPKLPSQIALWQMTTVLEKINFCFAFIPWNTKNEINKTNSL
jgi:hypothetical protein